MAKKRKYTDSSLGSYDVTCHCAGLFSEAVDGPLTNWHYCDLLQRINRTANLLRRIKTTSCTSGGLCVFWLKLFLKAMRISNVANMTNSQLHTAFLNHYQKHRYHINWNQLLKISHLDTMLSESLPFFPETTLSLMNSYLTKPMTETSKIVFEWKTPDDEYEGRTLYIRLLPDGYYDFIVQWGDGQQDTVLQRGNRNPSNPFGRRGISHTYSKNNSNYTVTLQGTVHGWDYEQHNIHIHEQLLD